MKTINIVFTKKDMDAIKRGHQIHEASNLPTDILVKEVRSRGFAVVRNDSHYGHNVDATGDTPYCTDCEVYVNA